MDGSPVAGAEPPSKRRRLIRGMAAAASVGTAIATGEALAAKGHCASCLGLSAAGTTAVEGLLLGAGAAAVAWGLCRSSAAATRRLGLAEPPAGREGAPAEDAASEVIWPPRRASGRRGRAGADARGRRPETSRRALLGGAGAAGVATLLDLKRAASRAARSAASRTAARLELRVVRALRRLERRALDSAARGGGMLALRGGSGCSDDSTASGSGRPRRLRGGSACSDDSSASGSGRPRRRRRKHVSASRSLPRRLPADFTYAPCTPASRKESGNGRGGASAASSPRRDALSDLAPLGVKQEEDDEEEADSDVSSAAPSPPAKAGAGPPAASSDEEHLLALADLGGSPSPKEGAAGDAQAAFALCDADGADRLGGA